MIGVQNFGLQKIYRNLKKVWVPSEKKMSKIHSLTRMRDVGNINHNLDINGMTNKG